MRKVPAAQAKGRNLVSTVELAVHLDTTPNTITVYAASNIIEKVERGLWDQDDCRKRVLKHLRMIAQGRARGSGGLDLSAERAKLAQAQTQAMDLKNSLARGDLVPTKWVADELSKDLSTMKDRLLVIPGKLAEPLGLMDVSQREEAIHDEICEALNVVRDPEGYVCGSDENQTGSVPSLDAAVEAIPRSMGRPRKARGGEDERNAGEVED